MGTKSTVDANGNATFNTINSTLTTGNVTVQGNNFNGLNELVKTDGSGKVPTSVLPAGTEVFRGEWNAATNTPTLSNSTIEPAGYYYHCNVAGTVNFGAGAISFEVGDHVESTGTIWVKLSDPSQSGRLLNVLTLTVSGTYTPSAGTQKIKFYLIGGGGAGGGTAAQSQTGGGGGASGGFLSGYVSASSSSIYTYSIGAGGVGGTNSSGGAGGNTAITINGITYQANGGGGGSNSSASGVYVDGGLAGSTSNNGYLNINGQYGFTGIAGDNQNRVVGGRGASSPYGTGAKSTPNANASGSAAFNYGSGGSGGSNGNGSTARAGGNGSQGLIIIEEYT